MGKGLLTQSDFRCLTSITIESMTAINGMIANAENSGTVGEGVTVVEGVVDGEGVGVDIGESVDFKVGTGEGEGAFVLNGTIRW